MNVKGLLESINRNYVIRLLVRGATGSLILNLTAAGVQVISQVIIARILGRNSYGSYSYVISWLSVLSVFAIFGFDNTIVRYLATYNANRNWGAFKGLVVRSQTIVLLISISLSILSVLLIQKILANSDKELALNFYIACGILPLLALASLRQSAVQALNHVVLAEVSLKILRPLLIIIFILMIHCFKNDVNAFHGTASNLLATLIVLSINIMIFTLMAPKAIKETKEDKFKNEWLKMAGPSVLIAGLMIVLRRTDLLIVGGVLGTPQAGIYIAASHISDLTAYGLLVMCTAGAPIFAELYSQGKKAELQKVLTVSAIVISVLSILFAVIIILFGKYLLGTFGREFTSAYWALVLLSIGQIFNALCGPVAVLMLMSGNQVAVVKIVFPIVCLNLLLNLFMVPKMGINGAALASLTSTIAWNIIMLIFVLRKLHLNPTVLPVLKKV